MLSEKKLPKALEVALRVGNGSDAPEKAVSKSSCPPTLAPHSTHRPSAQQVDAPNGDRGLRQHHANGQETQNLGVR